MKEFEIIDLIKKESESIQNQKDVVIGIGDDTALLSKNFGELLITQDSMSEGKHFRLDFSNGINVANKLFNSNISDIASMGGLPRFALITAGLTPEFNKTHLKDFISQVTKNSKDNGIVLIGGDTVSSNSGSAYFTMTLMGEKVDKDTVLTRNSGNVGDVICTTGFTGVSGYGLQLLFDALDTDSIANLANNKAVENHVNGTNRSDIISELIKYNITSMTDISDGLLSNAKMLPKKGNGIHLDYLPKSDLITIDNDKAIKKLILTGGEDYELVFSLAESDFNRLKIAIPSIHKVGVIIEDDKALVLGEEYVKDVDGFEHSF